MDKSEKRERLKQIDLEIAEVKKEISAGDNSFENQELLKLLQDEKVEVLNDNIDEEEYDD